MSEWSLGVRIFGIGNHDAVTGDSGAIRMVHFRNMAEDHYTGVAIRHPEAHEGHCYRPELFHYLKRREE